MDHKKFPIGWGNPVSEGSSPGRIGDANDMNKTGNKPRVRLEHYGTPATKKSVERRRTFTQLRRRLDELQPIRIDGLPITAYLHNERRECLGVVLGDQGWVLMHDNPEHTFQTFSLGNRRASSNELIVGAITSSSPLATRTG